jgi:hypothetical protein
MAADFADLISQINKAVYNCIPGMKINLKGMRYPKDAEEFVSFNGLALYDIRSRADTEAYRVFVEVIAYSKQAPYRADKKFMRVWEIAQAYRNLLSQKRIVVESTCVQFKEARLMSLDLNSLGDFAQAIDQQSPALGLDAVVIEVEGIITQVKE